MWPSYPLLLFCPLPFSSWLGLSSLISQYKHCHQQQGHVQAGFYARLVQELQPWALNLTRNCFSSAEIPGILHVSLQDLKQPWSSLPDLHNPIHCLSKTSGQTCGWAMILFFSPLVILVIHLLTWSEQEEEGHESLKGIDHTPVGAIDISQALSYSCVFCLHAAILLPRD